MTTLRCSYNSSYIWGAHCSGGQWLMLAKVRSRIMGCGWLWYWEGSSHQPSKKRLGEQEDWSVHFWDVHQGYRVVTYWLTAILPIHDASWLSDETWIMTMMMVSIYADPDIIIKNTGDALRNVQNSRPNLPRTPGIHRGLRLNGFDLEDMIPVPGHGRDVP